MAFLIPRDILTPRKLAATFDRAVRVIPAHDMHAYAQAQQMLATAIEQAETLEVSAQAAFEAERRRGYEDGIAQAKLEQAEQMIENVSRTVDYFARVESEMVELVLGAVRKIVLDFDDVTRVMTVVGSALAAVRNQKQITLRLAPSDVERVRGRIHEMLALYPGIGMVDLVPDERLTPSACILECEVGVVEASLEGQLAALRGAFERVLGNHL